MEVGGRDGRVGVVAVEARMSGWGWGWREGGL